MSSRKLKYIPKPLETADVTPFESAEEAWFWFIESQRAKEDGARFIAGLGRYNRPCEPIDILKIIERLHRQRKLLMDHFLVLRHYGRRQMRPDRRRAKEVRAYYLWKEAMEVIGEVMIAKGIVREKRSVCDGFHPVHAFSGQGEFPFLQDEGEKTL